MNTAVPLARDSRHRRFRMAVLVASVVAAIVGSVLLATRDSGEKTTTRGVTATLPVTGHPGSVVAGPDALWVALNGDPQGPVGDRPLLRLDLATGAVARTVYLGGQASRLAHVGDRLIASVQHIGSDGFGPTRLAVLDWLSGHVLFSRGFDGPIDQVVLRGNELWALEVRPGTLLRLDQLTLAPSSAPLRLSSGRTLGLASGGGYLWVTASDDGEVLRIDPVTRAITRVHVGGFPMGIVVAGGSIWFADRAGGTVGRLDPRTLHPVGDRIPVGAKPSWLAVAANSLFVTDEDDGTVARIDVRSGKKVGLPIRIAPSTNAATAPVLAPAGQSVWVSSFASNTLTRINSTVAASSVKGPVVASGSPITPAARRVLPRGGKVVAKIAFPSGFSFGSIAAGEGAVWFTTDNTSTLARIDPRRNTVVARIDVHPGGQVAAGNGAVWLSYPADNSVARIDPLTNKVIATIPVGPLPGGIAVSPGAVWVANAGGPSVSRIDPATNQVVATIQVGPARAASDRMSVTAGGGAIWAGVPNLNAVVRIDPATNAVSATVKVSYPPCGPLTADETAVWSAGGGCADVIGRVDPRRHRLTGTLEGELHPVGLALGFGSVWAGVLGSGNVDRIDPHTGRVVARLPVGGKPVLLTVGFGAVWVHDDTGNVLRIKPQG